mgnify:FL=1
MAGAAAGIGDSITAGGASSIAAAWNLRREIEAILAGTGTTIVLPGTGGGPSPENGDGPVTPAFTADNRVNVYVHNANLGNRTTVEGFAAEISAMQRSKLAGLGNLG